MDQTTASAASETQPHRLSEAEFIPLMALLTALDALSIDAMLPALSQIGRDLAVTNANDVQLVVGAMFLGMTLGQMVGGPLSDSVGRKPAIYWGLALYVVGCAIAILAPTFSILIGARVLQGLGASIPVVVSIAMVRDLYEGAPMARIMSFMGSVFILVPILAPLAGQGLLLVAPWRAIFVMFMILAIPASVWFALRQPETLIEDRRRAFSAAQLLDAAKQVLTNRVAVGYALATGLLFGAFLGYLSSTQQIFQVAFSVGRYFVLFFSSLSASIGLALVVNGKLVTHYGMQRMTMAAFVGLSALSIAFLPVAYAMGGVPPVWLFMLYLCPTFFCVGILFGNLNSLAMEPLGAVAGMGAAISSAITSALGLPLGTLVGRAFDGTVLPLVSGFAVLGSLALLAMLWAERERPPHPFEPLRKTG
jgi:DHA1 family bicyclomycin/chloramphenicol resistance-like MFS transporter